MAKRKPIYLMRDLAIVALSVIIAVVLAKTGILKDLLTATQTLKFVGSFVAGIFFVSIFTAAPATVVLIELLRANTIVEVAFFGGLGALIGDLIIFRFIKDAFAEDIRYLLEKSKIRGLVAIFKLGFVRWLAPLIGALIVISPLPDEFGLAMMGLSKMKTSLFVPISFTLNFLGILAIGLIAKTV